MMLGDRIWEEFTERIEFKNVICNSQKGNKILKKIKAPLNAGRDHTYVQMI